MAIKEIHFQGECLEALGIPSSGFAVIDPDAEPRVFDVVHCNDSAIAMCGYLKQIVRTGDKPIVQTAYVKDGVRIRFGICTKDYEFTSENNGCCDGSGKESNAYEPKT